MIDGNRRYLLRRFDLHAFESLVANVMLQRVKQHRLNVRGSGLKKVAEEIEIVFRVGERAGRRNKLKDFRQPVNKLQVLSMIGFSFTGFRRSS
jgi:hypothetical protein